MLKIIVDNVSKKFKDAVVLKDISVEFEAGKIYGLTGRNGSGKTMLLKCICGFVPVTSGTITVNKKIVGKDTDIPGNVGIIIETPGFLTNYNGFMNLKFLAGINNTIQNDRIKECMRMVGLDPNSKKWVGKYSLGMRQRLGIAQAIMENPSILLLDEPMNGLDKVGVDEMRKLFCTLKEQGKTIIIASHSVEDIRILCDIVFEMDSGKLTKLNLQREQCS